MKIELTHIKKQFGAVRANDDVSLVIESGSIHGLLGENGAGKTTLMKVLSGYLLADAGQMSLDARPARFASPAEAIRAGIGMLHQDPLDIPALTVLDNFVLGSGGGLAQKRVAARQELRRQCQRFGFDLDPDALCNTLTVGERQQLEIVRLLAQGVRVLILDEPTTGISAPQKALLFETLHKLADEGLSVIFVSHKLEEVEQLCSRVTVLRQGRVVGEMPAPLDTDRLVQLMFGQCLTSATRPSLELGQVTLELQQASVHTYRLTLESISLTVRRGEVMGLAGLEGSGQRLFMQACAGIQRLASGRLMIDEQDMTHQSYCHFLDKGVAFVPAARLEEGMVPGLQIREHVALTRDGHGFFMHWPQVDEQTRAMIQEYNIVGRPETMVQELSGGNQQRALLALLPRHLRLLILEHPTRGLDIESSRWVWNRLAERRREGTAILFTSTDLNELVENSDRLLVFAAGKVSAPLPAHTTTCEELGYLIGGKGV